MSSKVKHAVTRYGVKRYEVRVWREDAAGARETLWRTIAVAVTREEASAMARQRARYERSHQSGCIE
jgi:hypothetical protein